MIPFFFGLLTFAGVLFLHSCRLTGGGSKFSSFPDMLFLDTGSLSSMLLQEISQKPADPAAPA
jgi:hypothetical protein